MTPAEFRAARESLGLTGEALARVLHVNGSRIIRKWEAGEARVPGPVEVLMTILVEFPRIRRWIGIFEYEAVSNPDQKRPRSR